MRLDQNPLFRKGIVPWYDSDTACYVVIVFMVLVFLFGVGGILSAREALEYHEHIWVPVVLVVLSGGVMVSTILRLIKRSEDRFSE
jgi:hypothetical protein